MGRFGFRVLYTILGTFLACLPNLVFADEGASCWDKFQFAGNVTFSSEQLRQALIAEPDFLFATHPLSDRSELAEVIERLLTAGYREAGFPQPKIEAVASSDAHTEIRIKEGSRIRCSNVKVTGASQIDAKRLANRLSQPFPPKDSIPTFVEVGGKSLTQWIDLKGNQVKLQSPVWEQGTPAKLDIEKKLVPSVTAALKDIGWSATKFSVSIDMNTDDSTGELVVEIISEEMPDRIEGFNIVGSNINAPNDVIAFLDLKPGIVFDDSELQRLTKRLWDCGRFTKHNLSFERDEQGRGRLKIELADVPGVPSLDEPLSETTDILLRARRWLSSVNDRGQDIACTLEQEVGRVCFVQSGNGMAIELTVSNRPDLKNSDAVGEKIALIVDKSNITVCQTQNPTFWSGDIGRFQGSIRLESKFAASDSVDDFAKFGMHVSCHSERLKDEPLLMHVLRISPSDWSGFAYKENVKTSIADGRLVMTRDEDVLEIDIVSGEIYRWRSDSYDIQFQVGQFGRVQEEVAHEVEGKSNLYEPSQPVSSIVQWLLSKPSWKGIDEVRKSAGLKGEPLDPALRSACEKFVSGGLLKPLDAIALIAGMTRNEEQFSIPDDFAPAFNTKKMIGFIVAKPLLKTAPDFLAEGTWPMTVVREASLALLDRGQHTGKVLKALHSDPSNGPICDASVAYLLSLASQKKASMAFATNALRKMKSESFDRDIGSLLSGKSGRWFSDILNAVASLTSEEIDAIAQRLPNEETSDFLRDIHYRSTVSPFKESEWL
jgi:hypothetical protein